jgi:hypothetical protein
MNWTYVCPLVGVALLACATGETEEPRPFTPGLGNGAEAGGGATGSEVGGGGAESKAGAPSGGSIGEAGKGGTFVNMSGFTSGGTSFGTAGSSAGGAAQGGTGGSGGNGGSAGAGGKPAGGAGAGGVAGSGGSGGSGNVQCAGQTLPAKSTWKATAFESAPADPPERVFDGDNTTRFSTGDPQDGDEWLEIDFGKAVTVTEVTMHTNNNDYFRHYQLRLSDTSQDFAATILKEADGMTGTIVVPLGAARMGRYLTIRQTGMVAPTWWSLHEVTVACK